MFGKGAEPGAGGLREGHLQSGQDLGRRPKSPTPSSVCLVTVLLKGHGLTYTLPRCTRFDLGTNSPFPAAPAGLLLLPWTDTRADSAQMNEDAAGNKLVDERVTLRRFQRTGPRSGRTTPFSA